MVRKLGKKVGGGGSIQWGKKISQNKKNHTIIIKDFLPRTAIFSPIPFAGS